MKIGHRAFIVKVWCAVAVQLIQPVSHSRSSLTRQTLIGRSCSREDMVCILELAWALEMARWRHKSRPRRALCFN